MHAVLVEHDDLAVLDVAHVFRADDVERAGFGGEDRMAVELADHQRADAERIARADQLLVGEADEGVGAFELAQPLDEAVDEAVALGARDEMQDDLGVGGRLHDRAVAHQLAAQGEAVGQVAVVADREAAAVELGEQRLHVAQDGFAGGRIAHMADRRHAGQAVDHLAAGEVVADQAHAALGMEPLAVEGDDAGGFLAAVLERVQAERGDRGGVGMAEDAEDAAFFAQPVAVEIEPGVAASFGHLAHLLVGSGLDHGLVSAVDQLLHAGAVGRRRSPAGSAGRIEVRTLAGRRLRSSSGFGRFNRFKMVLSGSSGNIDISQSPVPCSTTRDLALRTQSGWLRSAPARRRTGTPPPR